MRGAHTDSSSHPAPNALYGRMKGFVHGCIFKPVNTSPYDYVKSPDWNLKDSSGNSGNGKGAEARKTMEEPWHWHTQQRKMMKAEISDALKLRQWVVASLILGVVGVVFVVTAGLHWVVWLWKL